MSRLTPVNYALGEAKLDTIANPALGASIVITVPAGRLWRPRAIALRLTTSAAVATRTPYIDVQDSGTALYLRAPQLNGIPAATPGDFTWSIAAAVTTAGALGFQAGLGDVLMLAGHRFTVSAINLQAGDQFSAIRFHYEEWLVT